jgi:N-methylhydantoinase A
MLLGVDVGGTFTDAVLVTQTGAVHTAKAPTTPTEQSQGVLDAIRTVLSRAGAHAREVERFAHGMTVATNALLEGRGARTALIATEGFTDVIELGRQARPHLYHLCLANPAPLVPAELRFGARERTTPDGPLHPLEREPARALLERLAQARPEAIAVALLHSYAHPAHELALGALISELLPDAHLSLSHELVGTFREYERTATTVLDAALSPSLSASLRRLSASARAASLPEPEIMQSSGGLASCARAAAHAAVTVLSGPAGGVGGALLLARLAKEPNVLCFDMGGTSCDVCLIEQSQVGETSERSVAGRPLALPMLDIHTVGAGGGSIAWRDAGGALRVGPASAGALPGPACYGRGGTEPTVTDANLLLGRLLANTPLPGGIVLERSAAERAVARLARELGLETVHCAEGIVAVAEAEMLRALRVMTVERGIDPRRFALMPFGGAGPLHAAALARELGISRILCPRASGVLSALGLAAAAPRRDVARTVMLSGHTLSAQQLSEQRESLLRRATAELMQAPVRVRVRYELRYRGQSFELPVEVASEPVDPHVLCDAFERAHEHRYGYRDEQAEIELVTLRVSVWGAAPRVHIGQPPSEREPSGVGEPANMGDPAGASEPANMGDAAGASEPANMGDPAGAGELADTVAEPTVHQTQSVVLDGRKLDVQCIEGECPAGTRVHGPAICVLPESTLLLPSGWAGEVDEQGTVRLSYAPPTR